MYKKIYLIISVFLLIPWQTNGMLSHAARTILPPNTEGYQWSQTDNSSHPNNFSAAQQAPPSDPTKKSRSACITMAAPLVFLLKTAVFSRDKDPNITTEYSIAKSIVTASATFAALYPAMSYCSFYAHEHSHAKTAEFFWPGSIKKIVVTPNGGYVQFNAKIPCAISGQLKYIPFLANGPIAGLGCAYLCAKGTRFIDSYSKSHDLGKALSTTMHTSVFKCLDLDNQTAAIASCCAYSQMHTQLYNLNPLYAGRDGNCIYSTLRHQDPWRLKNDFQTNTTNLSTKISDSQEFSNTKHNFASLVTERYPHKTIRPLFSLLHMKDSPLTTTDKFIRKGLIAHFKYQVMNKIIHHSISSLPIACLLYLNNKFEDLNEVI